uniref:Uncharacterized protein n=1 Tax=Arundo donax TaxID=35708 RepID=A0A0A9BZB2_ARUDO
MYKCTITQQFLHCGLIFFIFSSVRWTMLRQGSCSLEDQVQQFKIIQTKEVYNKSISNCYSSQKEREKGYCSLRIN